ncbi:MAG TPA: hypothetical protein VH253_17055 [Phycisphaerae bacterium]|nr:hypothetical protein [Phycisphaerae bacterium]
MAKRGRPKLLKADRRSQNINVRVTAEEVKAIDAAAEAVGKGRSRWLRGVILKAAGLGEGEEGADDSGA